MGLDSAGDLTDLGSKPHLCPSAGYDIAQARSVRLTIRVGGIRFAAFGNDLHRGDDRVESPESGIRRKE